MSKRKRLRWLVRNFQENGLKFVLENPGNARELLQLLHFQLLPRIDFANMRVVRGNYVGRDYRHLESDLVLQAPIKPGHAPLHRQIILYILIEHQSEPDRFMPLRVLEYVVMIYKHQMREWEKKHGNLDNFHLQPVLPIVLYTGTRTWDSLGSLWELVELGAELGELIPKLTPLFLNVGETSDDVLAQGGAFGLLLRLVQQRRKRLAVFEQTLREVVDVLRGLADKERNRWLELLSYIAALIYNEREVPEREPLLEKVADAVKDDAYRKEVFDMGRTIAEYLKEEGRQVGREEGLQEGDLRTQRRMLVKALRQKFGKIPAATLKRIEATEQFDLLDGWFEKTLDAKKLDEISFDPG
jgi:hypothetical protein